MYIAPGQHRDPCGIVSDGIDRMTVIRQFARRPGLFLFEFLLGVGLDLEAQIDAAKELYRLLDMHMVLWLDADEGQDLLRVMARAGDAPDFSSLEARVRETQSEVRRVFSALVGNGS